MKRQEHYVSDSYNDYLNKAIQNIYIPVNYTPILPEPRNGVIATLQNSFNEVEKLNERIKSTNDDMLKSSLRQQKNAICKRMVEYSGDSINKSQVHQDQEEYRVYKMKFWNEQEQDMDLMEKHYGEFKPANYSNNKMLLETKSYYEDLEDAINKTLIDKNIDQEFIDKTWQSVRQNYKNHVEKCESHEKFVKQMQAKVLEHGVLFGSADKPKSFIDAKNMAEQLNVNHKQAIDNLKFNSDQVVKQFITKGLEISGKSPEESSIILEIKSIGEHLEEKINKSLVDKNIDDEVKLQVWQMPFYSSKYKQVLDKLKTHEQFVRIYEDKILNCDSSSKANSLNMELKKMHQDVTEELNFHTNQAIKHFVTKALQISGKPLEETSMMSDIKSLANEFNEKTSKSWSENNISEKIKFAVDKLFHSKCEQHLEKLKLIEKSVQKSEHELLMCDSPKQAKYIADSLNQKQKDIDNWRLESDKLIEEITEKAIEFSYQMPAIVNPIENHQPNSLVPVDSVAISEIKSLLSKFPKKLNGSLSKENLNEKIKSDVCKITRSKCDQHLEQLKLIEKSIKKYEALPVSEKVINHLAQRYDQIEKWKHDSDNLIEQITNKAIEMSYQSGQSGQAQSILNQELLNKVAQLEEKLAQQQHPSFEALSSIAHPHSEPYSEPSLEEYNQEAQSLLEQNVEGDNEFNEKKDKIIKEIMDKLPDHPSLQQVQELKQELDYIRSVLAENQDQEANESLASSMDGYELELQNYCKGFVNEFANAFTSSQAVLGGGIKLDATKPIGESIATSIAEYGSRLIPIVGDAIATGIKTGSTYKAERKLKENCNNLNKFGVSTTRLDKIADYIAKKVIKDDVAKKTIKEYVPPATGNVKKFLDKINIKDEDSNQEKLGHIHAQKVLKEYIYNGKFKTLPLDSGNPVKKLLLDWMTDEFKKDDINEQAENNLPNLIDEVIVQAEEELANASLLPEGQGVIGGQIQSIQQPMGQLQSVVLPPLAQGQPSEMTREQMLLLIQQLRAENSAKDIIIQEKVDVIQERDNALINKDMIIQEKNSRIEQLEINPSLDPEEWISKAQVEVIIAESQIEMDKIKNDNLIMVEQKDNIIQQIIEESSAKDVLLEERDNTIGNLKNRLEEAQEHNKESKDTIKDLRSHRDDLKEKVKEQKDLTEKFKAKAESFKFKTQEKDVEITELKKIIDELKDQTQIYQVSDHHSEENDHVEIGGQVLTHEIVIE